MPYSPPVHGARRCPRHVPLAAKRDDKREPANRRGYDSRWYRLRNWYITKHPVCVECLKVGIVRPTEEVDHIVPIADGGPVYDVDNLQALCRQCHGRKTSRDIATRRKRGA